MYILKLLQEFASKIVYTSTLKSDSAILITPTEKKNETKTFFPLSRFGFQPVNDLI